MNFFDTDEPYRIAKVITRNSDLSTDLVAHCYLIMTEKENIKDEKKFFYTLCVRQWSLPNSEFNRKHRPVFTDEYIDEIFEHETDDVLHNDKYKQALNDYLNTKPKDSADWYIREVTLFWLDGKTYREIPINNRYITEAIKQFKHDLLNYFHSRCD